MGNSVAIPLSKTILDELNVDESNFESISFDISIEGHKQKVYRPGIVISDPVTSI